MRKLTIKRQRFENIQELQGCVQQISMGEGVGILKFYIIAIGGDVKTTHFRLGHH